MQPDAEIPAGLGPAQVLRLVARRPWHYVGRRWNYKSAVMSSSCRALLFFATNLTAGVGAAAGAMSAEFAFRFATAGYYGALTQAFRRVQTERAAILAVMALLPALGHGLELLLHWVRGTPNLQESIVASVGFTVLSTAFNLFVMRRGALITGEGSGSLAYDLSRMPALFGAFLMSWRSRPSI